MASVHISKSRKMGRSDMRYSPDPEQGLLPRAVNRAVEAAFADHGKGLVQMPPKL
ncbi:MAG: hypothetical protein WC342_04505 [Methanoregula sp.]|jgi:alanine dehydrogenase